MDSDVKDANELDSHKTKEELPRNNINPTTEEALRYKLRQKKVFNAFECKKCQEFFQSQSVYDQHMEDLHSEKVRATFEKKEELQEPQIPTESKEANTEHVLRKKRKYVRRKIKDDKPSESITMEYPDSNTINPITEDPLKPFVCDECGKSFKGKLSLRRHKLAHRDPSIKCKECKKSFRLQSAFAAHMLSHKEKYVCEPCDKPFDFRKRYLKHMLLAHNQRPFCADCPATFDTIEEYQVHIKEHDVTKCDICGKEFRGGGHYLKLHIANQHTFECEHCDKVFQKREVFKEHMSQEHPSVSQSFRCDLCNNKFFSDPISLENHKTLAHAFKCEKCGKHFKWKTSLIEHSDKPCVKKKDSDKWNTHVKCGICEAVFDSKENFDNHHSGHHPGISPTYKCTKCNLIYKKLQHLKYHQKIHEQPENYQCEMCNRSFCTIYWLGKHNILAHPELDFECSECKMTFFSQPRLDIHFKKMHEGADTFKCHVCDKGFGGVKKLKVHYKSSHPELKIKMEFKCNECGTLFESKVGLENHSRIHKQSKDYQYIECQYCKQVYKTKYHLLRHHKIKHPEHEPIFQYTCVVCEAVLPSWPAIKKHAKTHETKSSVKNLKKKRGHPKTVESIGEEECSDISESTDEDEIGSESDTSEGISVNGSLSAEGVQNQPKKRRILQESIEIGLYECQRCSAAFETFHELETHGKLHISSLHDDSGFVQGTDSGILDNEVQGMQTNSNGESVERSKVLEDQVELGRFECGQCSARFEKFFQLEDHGKMHIPRLDHSTGSETTISYQQEAVSVPEIDVEDFVEIELFECGQCTAVFNSFYQLEEHGKVHIERLNAEGSYAMVKIPAHLTVTQKFECCECKAVFTSCEDFEKHSKIHINTAVMNI